MDAYKKKCILIVREEFLGQRVLLRAHFFRKCYNVKLKMNLNYFACR